MVSITKSNNNIIYLDNIHHYIFEIYHIILKLINSESERIININLKRKINTS